jgi:hypothetical protein
VILYKVVKFFNIDLHISVIEDIKFIFSELGHEVDSWCISGHNWVFNRDTPNVEIIDQNRWKNIDQSICDKFYERYKDELCDYDAFISCYPPVFALLYEKFNKPIFIVSATRYEYPLSSDPERWQWLDKKLKSMIDNGQIIATANNRYDKFYCEYFLEREFQHIPSICEYTNSKYSGSKDFIVSGRARINPYEHISDLGRFSWEDLYKYKSIIHIPYNISIMSIFEQYTANVPLIFPSLEFGKRLPNFLSELIFHENCRINNDNISDFKSDSALSLCDFYDSEWMPNLKYFNSLEDLKKLTTGDFSSDSENIRAFNVHRKKQILNMWSDVLSVI